MKIKLLFAFLLVSFFAVAQPTNYQKISARYRWIAGMYDSTLHIPSGVTPALRGGGWTGAGAIFFNTADSSLYTYTGYNWRKMGSDVDSLIYSTRAWRQKGDDSLGAVIAGIKTIYNSDGTLSGNRTVNGISKYFAFNSIDSVLFKKGASGGNIVLEPSSEGGLSQSKIVLTNDDGSRMMIQTGDGYLETFSGWYIRNTGGLAANTALSVNGDLAQTAPLIEVIQGANDTILRVLPSGSIGINNRTPAALLDIASTTNGVLIPRMTTTQRNAISLPAIGLIIYNTTDSAFNFYRTSGWSSIGGSSSSYTFSNGLTEAAGAVKLGGTISESTQIYPDTDDAYDLDIGDPISFKNILINANRRLIIGTTNPVTNWSSEIHFYDDSLVLRPGLSKLYVDSLNHTVSTTGKKLMIRDTASGLVENIDPALLGGGSTNTSVGSGYKVAIDGTNNIKSLTGGYGITLDSATSNQVGIKVDSATLHNYFSIKTVQVTDSLIAANWSLVSGLYEYDLSNANVTAAKIVDVIPKNADIPIVQAAIIYPMTISGAGTLKLYSKNLPTAGIGVYLNIRE